MQMYVYYRGQYVYCEYLFWYSSWISHIWAEKPSLNLLGQRLWLEQEIVQVNHRKQSHARHDTALHVFSKRIDK